MHARGAGAHGVFEGYGTADESRVAGFLAKGRETPVFVRFSTVLGSRGSADTVRDTRGFATKFYTDEGNFDLVGNNIPVFFIQDGIKFPDVIHAGKPHPDREIPQAQSAHDTFWDFVSLHTEAQHHTIWNMSDRGIPRSYRMMEGFGVHTFRLHQRRGPDLAGQVPLEARARRALPDLGGGAALGGLDPDFHRRDLADAIESGAFPQWELGVQVFADTEDQMFAGIDLLDPTKIVPEELAPVQPIGRLTLNANPTNFFAETEQVAFHVGHLVPGHRRHRRPAAAGAALLLRRHPADPARAARTSTRSRSTGRTPRSTTCCATASTSTRCTAAWRRTGPTPSTAAARSSPAPTTSAFVDAPVRSPRRPRCARTRRRTTTTTARCGSSG